ncbi:MAG TPA: hypothetical protein VMM78_15830 [Thermomicrobiales bacterium]|nr:hypothetical protein [Thermomicrobiales bacterium]
MMGRKHRIFDAIDVLTLDDLVPAEHFYRHVERCLDLAFVRHLVADCYASGGRPSIDPVVIFKLCAESGRGFLPSRTTSCAHPWIIARRLRSA